jgi:PAS domain S-box-containing protein
MAEKPTYEELQKRVHELEKAESERNLAEDHLKKIFDNTQDAIFIHDLEGKIFDVNDKMCRMYGLTREEALEVTIEDVSSSKMSVDVLQEKWQKVLNGEKLLFEWEARRPKDESVFNVEVSIQKISFHDKDVVLANVHDITERRRMENENLTLANIIKRSQDFIGVADMEGNPFFVNPAGQALIGLNGDEAVKSTTIKDYFTEEDLPFVEETILPTLMTEGRWQGEYRFRHFKTSAPITLLYDLFLTENPETGQVTNIATISRDITERKLAEEALRERENQISSIFRSAPVGIGSVVNRVLIKVNKHMCEMTGYDETELIGQSSRMLYPSDEDFEFVGSKKYAQIADHGTGTVETRWQKKDGTIIDVFLSSTPVDLNDHSKGVTFTALDITEGKKAEKALLESEDRFKKLSSFTFEGIVIHNNAIAIDVNQSFVRMLGYEREEIIGMNLFKLIHPDDHETTKVNLSKQVATPYEISAIRKDGSTFFAEIEARNIFYNNEFFRVACIRDITERKRAEEALKAERDQILSLFNSIDEIIYIADPQTHELLYINHHLADLVSENCIGEKCYKVLQNLESPCPFCTNDIILENMYEPHRWEYYNPFLDQHYAIIDRIIRWFDGRDVRFEMAVDISNVKKTEAERENLQTQLNQAQKLESVGRLAGGVAHDFNNMLGVILGHTEMALLQADENHELYGDLKEIQKAAKRSADITKQLLAFARKQTISPKQLDLNNTVESMLNMLRRLIGEDIDLVWKPSAHLWSVKMDPSQIDQILANLCVNARDAIDGVGKLTIETGKKSFDEQYCNEHPGFIPGDFVLLAVSDNGSGMDKDTLDNLFEPFFTTKEVGKGTGLGLSTVYGIVKQNNGFINVYSEPGQGSTFKIYLPRFSADEDTDMAMPQNKAAAGGTETIMLVEDEPTILRMTRMMLERKGYTVISAATPAEAIEKAEKYSGTIDMLMTDVVMPGMNGRDLADQIIVLYPGIRILFMSGYTSNVIAHQGVLDHGVAFIQKPFSMADMTEKVRELLDTAPNKNQG